MLVEPRLPLDLERTIFEMTARGDPSTALRIILVAHRCRSWIEPILYRSVVIRQSSWNLPLFLRTLESKPAHFAKLIKAIRIDPYIILNEPAVCRILSICTGIVHLVDLSYGCTPFSVLSPLRLERMCISLDVVDGLAESAYFRHPAFAHLTHLQVLDSSKKWSQIPFADLPSLTHLALQNYITEIRSANVPILQAILTSCLRLEVLVVYIPLCRPEVQNAQSTKLVVDDPRLVILSRTFNSIYDLWLRPFEECREQENIAIDTHQLGTILGEPRYAESSLLRLFDSFVSLKPKRRRRKKDTSSWDLTLTIASN
ncbi:hypothetical protein B0H11DRAFT_1725478 [Mycena galericulata]|nr:hypothetical protein B0H11DRAFT_1725478 [Mycena galericulata]